MNPNQIVNAISGLIQSAQGGWDTGSSQNAYQAYSGILNTAATLAGTGPWALGLNAAAIENNTISALVAWQNGQLQPSDILQITASSLSLVVAATAIAGAPVTATALGLAAIVGIVAGPGVNEQPKQPKGSE